jgi:hypothetical protein
MDDTQILVGRTPAKLPPAGAEGAYVDLAGQRFFRISNVDTMTPFLMSLASDSDHWLFVSSTGALTAGRGNPDRALFPYTTDDRIHDARDRVGGKSLLLVHGARGRSLWEPFSERLQGVYRVTRNLYKNVPGNVLVFEEVNHDLELSFRQSWQTSERFGFVRTSTLSSQRGGATRVEVLDGVQNLLPPGIGRRYQMEFSTLADGYKDNELDPETGLGLFRLSSVPTDQPALPGQLAGHLPELGGTAAAFPGFTGEYDRTIRQRHHMPTATIPTGSPGRVRVGGAEEADSPGPTSATGATTRSSTC